ncbi:Hypothetical predicted protein [Cloeon dipterum]|uniref:PR domain zinc finger protein 10 n=1 Tax=Cloeon dipterum TaxID=197152 RepID=A0A8S1C0K7_9INSE|nr:Hypothetical predicted protein [Cloeon dipterum]
METGREPPDGLKVEDWAAATSCQLGQVAFVEGEGQFVTFTEQPTGDFEDEVSPLDPNMSSVACYSPVYSKNMQFYPQTSDICVSSSTGPVDEQATIEFLDEKKLVMDGKVDSSGDEELRDVQRFIATSAAQSFLVNSGGGMVPEQLLGAIRNRSDRGMEEKERGLAIAMYDEMLKEMAEEVDKHQECRMEKEENKVISDEPVQSRAWATLPSTFLSIGKLNKIPGYGIFARKPIPKKTQFGPLEGDILKQPNATCQGLELSLELEDGTLVYYDTSNENLSNWMKFVRPAKLYEEMNVVVVQIKDSLHFITTKAIQPKQELLVGYSEQYASSRNLSLLQPLNAENSENVHSHCDKTFLSSEAMEEHLVDQQEKAAPVKRKVLSHLPIKKCKSEDNSSGEETAEFRCNTCSRNFPRSYSLKRHLLLHSADKNTKKSSGKDKSDRNVLKQKNQSKESLWACNYCQLSFETASMLNLHTLAHAAENVEEQDAAEAEKQQCPQCSQQYETKRELVEHTAAHGKSLRRRTVNPEKPHKCELCYKSFATDDRLQKHMLVHGAEETKPLQCEICFKRFLNNSALACHVKVHTEEKKVFECPICREVFEQVITLKDHVQTHCNNGVYTCPHCSKAFIGYSLVRKHIRTFHSERKHTCSSCGKLFHTLDKLRMHMLRHSDHREFLCANCGKQFKRKDKLKEHMKRMHSNEREAKQKPNRQSLSRKFIPKVSPTDYHRFTYKCHQCMLGFKRRGMLVNHLAKRHPSINPDTVPELNLPIMKTTRDYFCQYCEKVYKSSSKRKAHILKNHPGSELPMSNRRKGGVPEIPGVPNPTFSQTVGSISTHPHGCPWCHKQYASKAKLLQHQRKKHSDLVASNMAHASQSSCVNSESSSDSDPKASSKFLVNGECLDVIQIQEASGNLISAVGLLPAGARIEYQVTGDQETIPDGRIYIDTSVLKQPLKASGTDMLSQALLSSDLLTDDYVKVYHAGNVVAEGASEEEQLVAVTSTQIESSQLRQLLQLGGGEGGREWAAYPAR